MLKKITDWFATFLELQLIISLLSLPVLIHWGLGISYMLPIANLIFTPLLALFLWCSCLFALCSITHLPCSWLSVSLDILAQIWNYLLSFARPDWLIGFHYSMIWLALPLTMLIFFLYTFFYPKKKYSLLILLSCCFLLFFIRWITVRKNSFYKIPNMALHTLRFNNTIFVIDSGALCSKQNFYNWIDYTILPELIKTGGITTIDTLVLYKPNKKLAKIVQQFVQQTMIKNILVTTEADCYKEIKIALADTTINVMPIYKKRSNYNFNSRSI